MSKPKWLSKLRCRLGHHKWNETVAYNDCQRFIIRSECQRCPTMEQYVFPKSVVK